MNWKRTPSGVLVGDKILNGEFSWRVNGGEWKRETNLLTDEGIDYLIGLSVAYPPGPDPFYIAPFGDDVTPLASWTAATFTTDSGELGDPPEGYQEATRQLWPVAVGDPDGSDNYTAAYVPATFHLRTASSLTVCGFGVLTDDTKAGTGGVLLGAIRLGGAPKTYDDNDILDIGYRIVAVNVP